MDTSNSAPLGNGEPEAGAEPQSQATPERHLPERSAPAPATPPPTGAPTPRPMPAGGAAARVTLMVTTGVIALLTFAFSFGNVWVLNLHLGVHPWIAPLVAPAVDLSVIGLLIAVQWLALAGASAKQLGPARKLLMACGVVTMALNCALPLTAGITTGDPWAYGRAGVEAIAPWLLIAWSHVGPLMLRLFSDLRERHASAVEAAERAQRQAAGLPEPTPEAPAPAKKAAPRSARSKTTAPRSGKASQPANNSATKTDAEYLEQLRHTAHELRTPLAYTDVAKVVGGGGSRVTRFLKAHQAELAEEKTG